MSDIQIIQTDALGWLEEHAHKTPAKFDCIITDPPYDSLLKWQGVGTTARMGFGRGKTAAESDKFYPTIDRDDMWQVLIDFDKLVKQNSHTYILCDGEYMPIILGWVRESGELSWNYSKPLVWDKVNAGMGYHWRGTHEYIVMLEKGKRRLNDLGKQDVLRHKRVTGGVPDRKTAGLNRGTSSQLHQGRRLGSGPILRLWRNRCRVSEAQSQLHHHRYSGTRHISRTTEVGRCGCCNRYIVVNSCHYGIF